MSEYLVIIEPSSTGFGAWSPDLGVYATGDTKEATIVQIREAIAFHVEGLREAGDPVPAPTVDTVLVAA
ncbi:MAG TPA: type II toxin-antitoxin system HicB family antitoxin [Candidatus Saccharimonadales bacterium]|nr:type II toxin-antitoxin system HicB family antitoxin [Candidatus Saccharimonadales bacterium]